MSIEYPNVKNISTSLSFVDYLHALKVRWGISRMSYIVEPGLYRIGAANSESPVFVSANYKLTFDTLRKNLKDIDGWLLILDTDGINVWCAAGKGTFGTDELINRIERSELSKYVSHKKLILPQLGATGVSAHEVKRRSEYDIEYGPVRATDIKAYIAAGNIVTKEMRMVEFTLWDRVILTPMELLPALKYSLPVLGVILATEALLKVPFNKSEVPLGIGAVASGTVLTPILLPYIPGRSFALKGWITSFITTTGILGLLGRFKKKNITSITGSLLMYPALASYLALNFTGSSTYTSPSGVNKEMKKALPLIGSSAAIGAAITIGIRLLGRSKKR